MGKNNYIEYLKDNSLVREELFNLRLFYDLKKAATLREYHLKIFSANVDFEGYDIVIDDNKKIGRYQIKTMMDSTVGTWDIHKGMLLPNRRDAESMRFSNGLCSHNDNGVILIDIISFKDDFKLQYYYTDFYIIKLIESGLIKRPRNIVKTANNKIAELVGTKSLNSKTGICKSLFLKIKDATSLLTICGYDSNENIHIRFLCMNLFKDNKINVQPINEDSEIASHKIMLQNAIEQISIR